MSADKGKSDKKKGGSSLTDAVVAALAKVEDEPAKAEEAGEPAKAPEAGCASTQVASDAAAAGSNGFRNGPGSFSDLTRRWSGGAPMAAAPAAQPAAEAEGQAPAAQPEPPPAESGETTIPEGGPDEGEVTVADPEPASGAGAPEPPKVAADTEAKGQLDETETIVDDDTEQVDTRELQKGMEQASKEATPGGPVEVRYFGRTDVGLVREHNEDNYLVADLSADDRNPEAPREATVTEEGCVFSICDGMGGAAAGEVASQMAVDTIFEVMDAKPVPEDRDDFARRLVTSIEEAGQRIFSAAKMDRSRRGMGTTATVAGMVDNVLFVGQVGDSRAYVLRGDQFAMVTKDQSLVNQLIEAGQLTEEEAEAFEHSNIILQALGTTEEVTVDLTFLELRRGDRLMMCSDGLSGLVHGDMIKEVLQGTEDQVEAAAKLIQMANAGGGHDNISVIVADFDGEGLSDDVSAPVRYQQYPLPPSDERRKSLPPRDTSMKPGATKPGADVKRDTPAGPSEDVEVPTGESNTMLYVMIVALVLVGAAGAWLIWGRGEGADTDAPPPPSGQTDVLPQTPVEPEDTDVEPIPEGPVELQPGTITVTSDVEEGTLYINGQLHGPLEDGMTIELDPGGYTLEARTGETAIAQQTITVTEGAAIEVGLSVPVGASEELPGQDDGPRTQPQHPPPQQQTGGGATGGQQQTGGGGQGGGAGGRTRRGGGQRGGQDGPLPTNPF